MKKIMMIAAILAGFLTQVNAADVKVDTVLEDAVMKKITYKSYGDYSKRSIIDTSIKGDIANVKVEISTPNREKGIIREMIPGLDVDIRVENWLYQKNNGIWEYTGATALNK